MMIRLRRTASGRGAARPALPVVHRHHRHRKPSHVESSILSAFLDPTTPRQPPPQSIPHNMPQLLSPVALRALRTLIQRPTPSSTPLRFLTTTTKPLSRQLPTTPRRTFQPVFRTQRALTLQQTTGKRQFSSSPIIRATYNQVKRGCRKGQRARRARSPALKYHPTMKGVCLKTGITKPKKPNSGERKVARVRLSSGKVITAVIPGEGHNIQQHSVVQVRGGRAPDCPGVKYHLIRGAMDLVC